MTSIDKNKTEEKKAPIQFCWDKYSFYSNESSKVSRQLAFAEGAIFWVLYAEIICKPKELIVIFYFCLLLYFVFDLLQYMVGMFAFKSSAENMKNLIIKHKELESTLKVGDIPGEKNFIYYVLKMLFLMIASFIMVILFVLYLQ